jgi:hypothetical protein
MRLSITTVEAYRMFRDYDWMTLEDLEATITKTAPANDNMLRGKAFHAIIEDPAACKYDATHYDADGWAFDGEGIERVLDLLPTGRVVEVKSTVVVDGITLSGVADALAGLGVYEAKCTARIDVEKYFDSFQWRAYLKMFNAQWVRYVLAQYAEKGGVVSIPNVLPMTLYRYPKLDEDVQRLANECAEFVVQRGLPDHVKDKAA